MYPVRWIAVAMVGLSLAGCIGERAGETLGAAGGVPDSGITGNQIGSGQIGSGSGQAFATTTGVTTNRMVAGSLIGNRIGAAAGEDARSRATEAEYQALQFGPPNSPVVWRDPDENVYGEVVPGAPYQVGGFNCRDYTHTIYIDGRADVEGGTACQQPDGLWRRAG